MVLVRESLGKYQCVLSCSRFPEGRIPPARVMVMVPWQACRVPSSALGWRWLSGGLIRVQVHCRSRNPSNGSCLEMRIQVAHLFCESHHLFVKTWLIVHSPLVIGLSRHVKWCRTQRDPRRRCYKRSSRGRYSLCHYYGYQYYCVMRLPIPERADLRRCCVTPGGIPHCTSFSFFFLGGCF